MRLVFVVVLAIVGINAAALSESDRTNCMGNPLCKSLYQAQNYVMPNSDAFNVISMNSATESTEEKLHVANLIIAELALNLRRCSPNAYWVWDNNIESGHCQCYFDRDCSQALVAATQTTFHPILLFMSSALLAVVVVFIVVRIVYSPALIVKEL